MNSIYGLLGSSNSNSFESGQILKLCEYVQENDSPTQPCGATRILLQMALYAKPVDVCITISKIYATIVPASDVEFSEFALLGGGIVQLCELVAEYGAAALRGCNVDLPFSDLDCEPRKYALSITSQKSLERLMTFWCCTAQHIFEDTSQFCILNRHAASIMQSLAELSSILTECTVGSDTVVYVCGAVEAVAAVMPAAESIPGEGCHCKISQGLLRWVAGRMRNAGDVLAQNTKDAKFSRARPSDGAESAAPTVVQRCVSCILRLLHPAGGDSPARSASASTESVLTTVLGMLRDYVVPHCQAIADAECAWWASLAGSSAPPAGPRSPLAKGSGADRSTGLALQTTSFSSSAAPVAGGSSFPLDVCAEENFLTGAAVELLRLLEALATHSPVSATAILQSPHALALLRSLCASLSLLDAVGRLLATLSQTQTVTATTSEGGTSTTAALLDTFLEVVSDTPLADPNEDEEPSEGGAFLRMAQLILAVEVACASSLPARTSRAKSAQSCVTWYQRGFADALQSPPLPIARREGAGQRLRWAWTLMESALRMRHAVGDDSLWDFLPPSIGAMVGTALEVTRPAVAAILPSAAGKANLASGEHPDLEATSSEERFAEALVRGSAADPSMRRLAVWLRAACLAIPAASSDITTAATQMLPAKNAAAAPAGKRKRVQDADSFDFFEEEDSGADTAAAGVTSSARKRLKKRAASSPSTGGAGAGMRGEGSKATRGALQQSALLAQTGFLGENGLCGHAVLVLAGQLRHDLDASRGGAVDSLAAVLRTADSVAMLMPALGTACAPVLIRALGEILGSCLVVITRVLWNAADGLHIVLPYNSTVHHLLRPAADLRLDDAHHRPEYFVFVAQAALHAHRFAQRNALSVHAERESDTARLVAAVSSVSKLLQPLRAQFSVSATSVLSARPIGKGRAESGESESELPGSEGQSEFAPAGDGQANSVEAEALTTHLGFVLQFRSLHCMLKCCAVTLISGNQKPTTQPDSTALDSVVQKLLVHAVAEHCAMVRVAQCVTVSLLEAQYQQQLAESSSVAASKVTPVMDTAVAQAALSVLDLAFSARTPGNKIATIGLCRFVKYAALLHPTNGVLALKELCLSRAAVPEALGADTFSAELHALSEGGVLATLLATSLTETVDAIVMPLLTAAAEGGPEEEVVEVVDGILSLLDRHTTGHGSAASLLDACRAPLFARLSQLNASLAGRIGSLLRERRIYFALPERFLMDEETGLFLELVKAKPESTVADLLEGGVFTALSVCAKGLGVAVADASSSSCMTTVTFHHMLLRVVWSLGCSPPGAKSDDSAVKALKALCTLATEQVWRLNRRSDPKSLAPERINDAVAEKLQVDFLYIMANLLLKDWSAQTQAYHEQSLRCFRALIGLLRQSDVVKFLPKILIVVDSALGSKSPRARLAAVELVATLCPLLPVEALGEHLSSLVVSLYPLLEFGLGGSVAEDTVKPAYLASAQTQRGGLSFTATQAPGGAVRGRANHGADARAEQMLPAAPAEVELFGEDLRRFGRLARSANATAVPRSSRVGLSNLCSLLMETAHAVELGKTWTLEIKSIAVEIIRNLFLQRREDIQAYIQSIAYIPHIAELKGVHTLHQQEVRAMTLEQTLQLLCSMLSHASSHVRLVAVNRLTTMCRENREQLNHILEACSTDTTASSASDHIVSQMLQALLRLCSREGDKRVQSACARCFGEIGAIDPTRVNVRLDTRSTEPAANAIGDAASTQHPWKMEQKDLCLTLLQNHLVPGLRSADGSAAQDKSSFAIQVILRELAAALSDGGMNAGPATAAVMPEQLRDLLASRAILEVTEPFWSTSYTMNEAYPVRVPPIYFPGLSFARWISLFTRYLICQSAGPLRSLFMACRGVVRIRTELCQFLLPHLIYDVLTNTPFESIDGQIPSPTTPHPLKAIIHEICAVLNGAADGGSRHGGFASVPIQPAENKHFHSDQMCIQSVFSLMDTLSSWVTRCVVKIGASYPRASPYADIARFTGSSYNMDENGISRVKLLVDAIPLEFLGKAALEIKAYTRALRYLEIHARQAHRLGGNGTAGTPSANPDVVLGKAYPPVSVMPSKKSSGQADQALVKGGIWSPDRAGGALPFLSAAQIDSLMAAFSSLEDPDSLQGALVMNHVFSHPADMWHRILELELTDNWLGALLEYGLVHNGQQFSNSLHMYTHNPTGEKKLTHAAIKAEALVPVRAPSCVSGSSSSDSGRPPQSPSRLPQLQTAEAPMPLTDIVELERRKLRCMVELGHFDAVIDQASAVGSKLCELEAALVPLGTEAAWRLMRWDDLDNFLSRYDTGGSGLTAQQQGTRAPLALPALDSDRFQLGVGKLLQCLQRRTRTEFDAEMEKVRGQTMSALSAASMESYGRAYPMLARLHTLHELQCGYDLSLQPEVGAEGKTGYLEGLGWEKRLNFMSPSVPQRSTILAVRRCILGVCGLQQQVAQNWLQLSHSMCRLGKFDAAHLAVRNAELHGLDPESVLLQECRIHRGSGEVSRALMMLEPVELDLAAINTALRGHKQGGALPVFIDSEAKRKSLAERIRLATQLMVDSKQKQGNAIIARYKTVIALDKHWMEAYFDLAKYYEFLYYDARTKHQQTVADLQALLDSPNSNNPPANAKGPSQLALLQQQLPQDTQVMCTNLQQAVEMFGNCLMLGSELAMQVLPRLLTLWLTFTAQADSSASVLQRAGTGTGNGGNRRVENTSILEAAQARANESMARICTEVPASTWYLCMSQVVSRVLHRNEETVKVLEAILLKILSAYPKEGIWHMAALMFSFNGDRKKIAKRLLQSTYKVLSAAKSPDAAMLVDSQKVCNKLIELAGFQCKERKIRWLMSPDVHLENFLVPTQAVLHHTNPLRLLDLTTNASTTGAADASTGSSSSGNYYHADRMFIASFNETVDVATSKAKPKTITLRTVCGKTVRFLCKQEKDGDLRKDARMMEFNTVVNRLLQECPDGRKRHLRLRTFAVVCLNEECGILEWVNNTDCLRQLINKAHTFWPDLYPNLPYKDVYQDIIDLQAQHEDDLSKMMQRYAQVMAQSNYKPCFHRWFLEQFPDPTAWQEARARFVRSSAVWSAVGHVIGLGDRHTENILLDVSNGEMVQVDFDCLFDKGLTLQRPEIVPFRLTPNIVDAMGVTGVEGTYRRTLEVTVGVLRDNKDTLMSVLEPFLRDPTVSWSRSGRAQRSLDAATAAASTTGASKTVGARDHENREAKDMLLKISQRLSGIYNIVHPHREKFLRAAAKRNELPPARGIGVSKEEMLPLSVPGQVQRLIDEASAPENLVQMYIGWQPWV